MVKTIQINLSNKLFYSLIVLAIILVVSGFAIAYNSAYSGAVANSKASIMGHTADEIDGSIGGLSCRIVNQTFTASSGGYTSGTISCNSDEVLTGGACRDNNNNNDLIVQVIGTEIKERSYTCKTEQDIQIQIVCCKGILAA